MYKITLKRTNEINFFLAKSVKIQKFAQMKEDDIRLFNHQHKEQPNKDDIIVKFKNEETTFHKMNPQEQLYIDNALKVNNCETWSFSID